MGPLEKPLPELLNEMIGNLQELLRGEMRLAVTEAKEEGAKAARAGIWIVAGGVFAFYALGLLLLAAIYALGIVLAPWLAALIVAIASGVFAVVLIITGKSHFQNVHPKPEKTIRSMKENIAWARHQVK